MTDIKRHIIADEISTGNPSEVKVYREGRKCRLYGCPMSKYTPPPCCLAHTREWTLLQIVKAEKRAERIKRAYELKKQAKNKEIRDGKSKGSG